MRVNDLAKAGVLFRAKLPLAEARGNLWRRGRYMMCNFNNYKKNQLEWASAHSYDGIRKIRL
jgi:hypothetical protein